MIELKTTTPVARKEHICNWCGSKIAKGEKYHRQTIIFDGSIYDWISHLDCLELTGLLDMFDYDCYEGIDEYTFQECVQDYINEHHFNYETKKIDEGWGGLSVYDAVLKIKEELLESL